MNGFPEDDDLSLQQNFGECDLSIWYNYQFIQNETIESSGYRSIIEYKPQNKPLAQTLTGTVYHKGQAVQTFIDHYETKMVELTDIGTPEVKVLEGEYDPENGILHLTWSEAPGDHHLVVSYEYEMKEEPRQRKKPGTFVMPTFEKFFTGEEIDQLSREACTISCWDFNTALGDTIREKYESLYLKVVEMTNVLIAKGAQGYFWIVTSPEIASVFQTSYSYSPAPYDPEVHDCLKGQLPMGVPGVRYDGIVSSKWRLYIDNEIGQNRILIGCNDKKESPQHYGRIAVANFII